MKKEKNVKNKGFWGKMRFHYRIIALNENTLEEAWNTKLSILKICIYLIIYALILIAITSFFIIVSPIRYYLPGYMDSEVREKYLRTSLKLDSIEKAQSINMQYLNNLKLFIEGKVPEDYILDLDSNQIVLENDPRLSKSKIEQEFISQYEENEENTLNIIPSNDSRNQFFFEKPVNGNIIEKFGNNPEKNGIVFFVSKTEPVLASSNGTITYIGYDPDNKRTIQIQHKNGYLSIYKGLTEASKKIGDEVKSGEAIGNIKVDKQQDESKPQTLTYELWNKGQEQNPELFIIY